jgi:hypothetical protein
MDAGKLHMLCGIANLSRGPPRTRFKGVSKASFQFLAIERSGNFHQSSNIPFSSQPTTYQVND